jgi:lysozyme-like protein
LLAAENRRVIYSLRDLQSLAAATGFPDPALAASVAMAESGGNTCAQGDPNIGAHSCNGPNGTSTSFGLWQINTIHNPQYDPRSLLDPQYNARAALAISNGGATWRPWSTFKNGAYLKWYSNVVPGPEIVPPSQQKKGGVAVVAIGVVALVAAAGYGTYKLLSRAPEYEPEPEPEPEPIFPPEPVDFGRRF